MKKRDLDGAKKGTSSSIHLFCGDEYLVKNAARDFCAELTGENEENASLVLVDGSSLDYGDLYNEISTPSLFCSSKVICIDQAPIFVGKSNLDKLITKVCESWRAGERRASTRSLVQLLGSANIDIRDVEDDVSLLDDLVTSTLSDRDKETLMEVISALVENPILPGVRDDSLLLDLITSPLPSGITLVFTATVIDKKNKLYKALEKHGKITELTPLQEKYSAGLQKIYFKKLVEEFLAQYEKTITSGGLNKMYQRSGKDIRRIHSELTKMVAFVGSRTQITANDVEDLFLDFHEPMFYDFLSVLRTADPQKCLPALFDNLKIVSHPLQTLAAITSEFRKTIVARELLFTTLKNHWKSNITYDQFCILAKNVRSSQTAALKKSKFEPWSMKDYPLYLLLKNAQNYTMESLIMVMESILEAEILLKSTRIGSTSPDSVMQDLVLKICQLGSGKTAS